MRALVSPFADGGRNLALEEALYRAADGPFLLFWRSRPCVVVGRNQNVFAEADLAFCRARGIPVLRRASGGGTVFHDEGNVNCSLFLSGQTGRLSYDPFLDLYVSALRAIGVDARRHGVCDVYLGEKKLCGTAQAAQGGRVLTHATLLCRTDLRTLSDALRPGPAEIVGRGTASVRAEVINCGLDPDGLPAALAAQMAPGAALEAPAPAELAAAEALFEKYSDFEWNYGRSPAFTARADGMTLFVEKGRIARADDPALLGLPYLPDALPAPVARRFFRL